jgi:hypothetical protein
MSLQALEENARRAKEANSFHDYRPGSATAEYQECCRNADEIAQKAKDKLIRLNAPADRLERVDYLLGLYKVKKLSWLNEVYANRARVPSVLIAGPTRFPVRAKERQNAREDALYAQNPDSILDEIKGIGYNAKTIYSDDKNAVERIKAKIAALTTAPDPWGNNKAEIRRLKERLLKLAPEEFAEQQANITVNGAKTYEEIIALWDSGRKHKSRYIDDNRWYFDLPLDFTDGKRHYREFVSIEVDETSENLVSFNLQKRETELTPLTAERKYSIIIGRISGSGNKAVIYQHLKSLIPKAQEHKESAEETLDAETVTINGETAQVIRNQEDMRLQLIFTGKPSEATRSLLKSNGFRWAPSCTAWQRLLNDNAEWALKRIQG